MHGTVLPPERRSLPRNLRRAWSITGGMASLAVVPLTPPAPSADAAPWSLAQRILFRFGFAYFVFYCLPFPAGYLPWTEWIAEPYVDLWRWVAVQLGDLLGLGEVAVGPNGSGDTTADYLMVLFGVVLAGVATIVWSLVDQARRDHRTLHEVLRIGLRYALALTMLSYGLAKVLKSQFPEPSPGRLVQPVGEMSPMGLLWTFMGYSTPYTVFAGLAEVVGGVLLFWRRTTIAGALLIVVVMGNVVLLNFCYDVPVKLYSSHLLVMALVLLAPDAPRLARAVFARVAPLRVRRRRVALAAKLAFIGVGGYGMLDSYWESYTTRGDGAPKPALNASWEVEGFDDDERIRRVTISKRGAIVWSVAGKERPYKAAYDEAAGTLTLTGFGKDATTWTLRATRPDPEHLRLTGILDGLPVDVALRRRTDFLLIDRGFHWVNEYPFNR